jgi:type II secretory pathway pseudopilin PulG
MNFRYSKEDGFSLIEALFSLLIGGILIVSTLYGFQTVFATFKRSNDFTRSIYLAASLLLREAIEPDSVEASGEFPAPDKGLFWELERYRSADNPKVTKARVIIKDRQKRYARFSTIVKTE